MFCRATVLLLSTTLAVETPAGPFEIHGLGSHPHACLYCRQEYITHWNVHFSGTGGQMGVEGRQHTHGLRGVLAMYFHKCTCPGTHCVSSSWSATAGKVAQLSKKEQRKKKAWRNHQTHGTSQLEAMVCWNWTFQSMASKSMSGTPPYFSSIHLNQDPDTGVAVYQIRKFTSNY